ncbi:cytochrome P450 [Streptomyces sp. NPDC020379]|uniref:cytochrome P450 n=1 Tax=Streptomyces sp. NPDC020379 TaxID=3365071 RepID=UPI0037B862A6
MTSPYTLATAPGAWPLLGHAFLLARRPFQFVASLPAHGDLVRIRLGPHEAYVVCHPDLVHQALVEDRVVDKGGPFYDRLREVAGNGLGTCQATDHRRQRRLVQPAFRRDRMPGYATIMSEETTALIADWHDDQVLNVPAAMDRLTTAVIARCLLGASADPGTDASELFAVYRSVDAVSSGISRRVMVPVPMIGKLPTPGNRHFTQAQAHLRQLTETLIADYRSAGVDHADLLSMLLAAPDGDDQGLSDTEIHDQVITFLLAGTETTASVLSWAWHLIGTHPHIQHQLQTETDTVLGGRPAHHSDLPALELTGRIVNETLRLYPPAWMTTRTTTTDTLLGGHALPAGTTLIYSAYQIHRRADLFPDPDRFDPDRWQSTGNPPKGTWIPFGGGARKCIGDTFALTQITLTLATIAAHWQLQPIPGKQVRPARRATLTPRELSMRLHQR